MAEISHDIRTLNGLIASVIDSVDGYSELAKTLTYRVLANSSSTAPTSVETYPSGFARKCLGLAAIPRMTERYWPPGTGPSLT